MEIDPRISSARVVILCGISGSGKTSFAHRLEPIGFERISADLLIWEKYGDGFLTLPPEIKQKAFMEVMGEIETVLLARLEKGRRVVLDATFCKRAKRDRIRQICREAGAHQCLVYFESSLPVLKSRLATRTGYGPDNQIVTPEQVEQYYRNFERPAADEIPVIITQE